MSLPPSANGDSGVFRALGRDNGVYLLEGELSFATVVYALKSLSGLFTPGAELCFDLAGIDRADSAGLALLLEWMRRAQKAGGSIRYIHLPEAVRAIARVSGVEELL